MYSTVQLSMRTDRERHEALGILNARYAFFVHGIEMLGRELVGILPLRRVPVDRPEVDGEQRICWNVAAANDHWFGHASCERRYD